MLDLIPPSYASATARDAWVIIAHYIPSSDLCAASLVCHKWHDLFMPFLWGDPASHFGTDNDAVYVALTRFRRTLKYARREVRALTHTLHMPPALSEIYGGPRPGWLRDLLDYLPCLQCLMVSRLPFFDHNAMAALKAQDPSVQYNVRLLLADNEPNTTSTGIAETLLRFPQLTYLDLSYTRSARDRSVLASISQLQHLQVLKLRGIGLKDSDAEFLANAIEKRVRFLDLRNNLLTDMAVRSLLQASFLAPGRSLPSPRRNGTSPDPVSQSIIRGAGSELLKLPQLDRQYIKILAQPSSGHAWIEDLPPSGITHLYISYNDITVEGVAGLLASSRLHALDAGTVHTADFIHKQTQSPKQGEYPGSEKLVPVIGKVAGENLSYLRSHHAVVTIEPPAKDAAPLGNLLPELESIQISDEHELDATNEIQIHELPGHHAPIYELADTSISEPTDTMTVTARERPLTTPYEDEEITIRRGSAFAPEIVRSVSDANSDISSPSFSPSGLGRSTTWQTLSSLPSILASDLDPEEGTNTMSTLPLCSSPISSDDPRAQMIQVLLSQRPRNQSLPLRGGKESRYPYLHPSHMPHLETLVLTDIPSHIPHNSPILYTLTRFITACSQESLLATLQAGSDYSLPPGQGRLQAEQQRSRSLFALRQIVLEVTDTSSRLTSWKPANQRNNPTISSTGDRDSEALWAAATDDYSFFGDEECGIPENDPGKYFPMAALNEKVSLMPSDDESTHSRTESPIPRSDTLQSVTSVSSSSPSSRDKQGRQQQSTLMQDVDLVAELAAFRRNKKAEYESLVRRERGRRSTNGSGLSVATTTSAQIAMAHFVEGHWKGEIKIVRNAIPKGRSGVVDMYGNYFEKGYLYP